MIDESNSYSWLEESPLTGNWPLTPHPQVANISNGIAGNSGHPVRIDKVASGSDPATPMVEAINSNG